MKHLLSILVLGAGWAQAQVITTFGSGTNQFQIEFVTIGNPGNAADTTGSPNPVGSVGYVYNIGKYEISRDLIFKFNASQSLQITVSDLTNTGGNGLLRPATGITWNEAARFVNWLNTSQGHQAAYNFSTSGANDNITLWGAGQYNGSNQFRHKDAVYVLPNMDEWYKAAYYDPNKAGGAGYWNFPTGIDTTPAEIRGGTSGAVYNSSPSGPADVTNAGGPSPFGTMGQGGNAYEWNETAFDGSNNTASENRTARGGGWFNPATDMNATNRVTLVPTGGDTVGIGFRVAIVPEPSSASLVILGLAAVLARRRCCRR